MLVRRSWQIEKERGEGFEAGAAPVVRFALALLEQRLIPVLTPPWPSGDPPHIAVFGGTNSGKSTLLNVLLGRPAAGMSFRARYSQHPEAHAAQKLGVSFLELYSTRFAAYARFHNQLPPRQSDDDLRRHGYRPAIALHTLSIEPGQGILEPAASGAVYWDAPDFSTEEAQAYLPAVLDAIALADLVLLAVTKENYADHRGAVLRSMVAESGVTLRIVANKLEDGSRLIDDIRGKLSAGGEHSSAPPIDTLPHVSGDNELTRLQLLLAQPAASHLRSVVAEEVGQSGALKRKAAIGAVDYLLRHRHEVLAPLEADAKLAAEWHKLVDRSAERELFQRYRKDYLDSQEYADFNLAVVRLLDLLELPLLGELISGTAEIIRTPFVWAMGGLKSLLAGSNPETPRPPEEEVVLASYQRWLESLKEEVQQRLQATGAPAWETVLRQLDSMKFLSKLEDQLAKSFLHYRQRMKELIDQRAKVLWAYVEERPTLRITLQTIKAGVDVSATVAVVKTLGLSVTDWLVASLAAPTLRLFLEALGETFMEQQKEALKQEQLEALRAIFETEMLAPFRELIRPEFAAEDLRRFDADLAEVRRAVVAVTAAN